MSTDETGRATVEIPKGVTLTVDGRTLRAKGKLGTIVRPFPSDALVLTVQGTEVSLELRLPSHRKRSQALLRTWAAHIANIAGGLTRGEELLIENFLGEKHPRSTHLLHGTKAVVEGEIVTITGNDVEQVGQSAANVERATRIREYDPRVFQDGIYLIERAHL